MLSRHYPRPHPCLLRRSPPGGQCRADPAGHPRPAPGPARTRPAAPRPGQCPGAGQHRRQDDDPGCVCAGWWRLHRRRRRVAHRRDRPRPGRHSQGAVHPPPSRGQALGTFLRSFRWGHVRQLDRVSREPRAASPGLGGWGRTRRRAPDHRPGLHHLRDLLRTGQGGSATPWPAPYLIRGLHRQAGLSPAAGRGRRNRRRADVPAARGPRQHRSGRRPLPA